jgi:2-polyprenyl-6-methoxyphenol hydroxylase-like FAD-dependent oxidoreductase
MSPSTPALLPVLIAGAGPVGLFEALLLTQLGIPVRIIDRELAISPYSRALGLHCRTMEILQFTGIIDSFLDKGKPMTNVSYYRNSRLVGSLPVIQAPEQSRFSTGMFLEQAKTSEILLTKLKELGVEVEYGWELLDTKVVDGRDGEEEYVETAIRRALVGGQVVKGGEDKDYETQVVRSKYLVACDGGRSTVRHKINIAFPGRSLAQKILMWDGHCECDIPFTGPTYVDFFCTWRILALCFSLLYLIIDFIH